MPIRSRRGREPLAAVFVLVLISLCPLKTLSAEESAPGNPSAADDAINQRIPLFASDHGGYFAWSRPLAILAVGGMAAAMSWNHEHPERMKRTLNASPFEPTMDVGNTYGSGWIVGGGSLATLAIGRLTRDDRIESFGADLCRSYLISSALAGVIKFSVDRRRPSGGGLSFPSGHTSAAFSAVPVIAHHLGWQAGVTSAFLAVSTGLGRMEDGRHYLSDVLFGAAIGLATGDAVVHHRKDRRLLDGLVVTPDHARYTLRF
jgi:hypothetical protein